MYQQTTGTVTCFRIEGPKSSEPFLQHADVSDRVRLDGLKSRTLGAKPLFLNPGLGLQGFRVRSEPSAHRYCCLGFYAVRDAGFSSSHTCRAVRLTLTLRRLKHTCGSMLQIPRIWQLDRHSSLLGNSSMHCENRNLDTTPSIAKTLDLEGQR